MTTWRAWLHGLGAALIGGAATAGSGALGAMVAGIDPLSSAFWKITLGACIGGGVISALAYLSKSPLPDVERK